MSFPPNTWRVVQRARQYLCACLLAGWASEATADGLQFPPAPENEFLRACGIPGVGDLTPEQRLAVEECGRRIFERQQDSFRTFPSIRPMPWENIVPSPPPPNGERLRDSMHELEAERRHRELMDALHRLER